MSDPHPRPTVRSSSHPFPDVALLIYLLLSTLFLGEAALTGRAYVLRDVLTFFHPWQSAVRDSVHAGVLPMWNHDSLCGVPLLANLQSGVFYPLNWLYWFLPFDRALTLGMVLHATLAAFLLRGFLRRVGLVEPAAFLGGALFAYGTWTLSHLEFPMQLGAAVWIPLLWSGIWQAMREENERGLAKGGAALALSVLAGYPQVTFYGLLSGTLLALVLLPETLRGERRRRVRRAVAWPVILVLGALAAAVQLLPSKEMAKLSSKAAPYTPEVAMTRSLPPQALVGLFDPFFLGFPGVDRYWGGETVEFAFGTFYLGTMSLVWIGAAGVAFAKPKRRRRVRREDLAVPEPKPIVPHVVAWFLALGAFLGLVIALGRHTPVYPLLHEYVPGFGRTRWPAAAVFLVAIHLAGLAAVGFGALVTDAGRARRAARFLLGLGAFLVAIWALASGPLAAPIGFLQRAGATVWQTSAWDGARADWLATLLPRGVLVLLAGALGLGLPLARHRLALGWILVLLADLLLTARAFRTPVASGFYDSVPESTARLAEDLDGHRVFVSGSTSQLGNFLYGSRNLTAFEWAKHALLCNANLPAGVPAASGCEPLAPRRHGAFVQAFESPATSWELKERVFDLWDAALHLAAPRMRPIDVPRIEDPSAGIVTSQHEPRLGRAMLLTGWDVGAEGPAVLERLFSPGHDPSRVTLLEPPPGDGSPALSPQRPSRRGENLACEIRPNSIHVAWQVGPGGMLRILESWDPGWTAKVNGRAAPVYRADFLFLAVPVPEGHCEVELEYRSPGLFAGAGVSAAAWLAVAGLLLFRRRTPAILAPRPRADSDLVPSPAGIPPRRRA